ncbi:MAG: response regulator [Deltaproteobacteria bacterium]|nr:response regulator [Deltaproteobacteria bacterium]MDQ3297589.1 ATP-binding protein [Myxococcota bacterium]
MARSSPAFGFVVAVVAIAAALGLRYLLIPVLGGRTPFILLFPAVVLAARIGGRWPALFAVVLGAVCALLVFPVRYHIAPTSSSYWGGLVIFVVVSVALIEIVVAAGRVSRQAKRTEERLQLTLAAGRLGVWEWDLVTGEISWSSSLESVHGLPRGAFGRTMEAFRQLVHADDRARVDAALAHAIDRQGDYDLEYRFLWPDGSIHWMSATGRVFVDEEGRANRVVGTAMDITARKEVETTLQEADRRKDEFIAVLAHELRNPLAPMRLALEMLRDTSDGAALDRAKNVMGRQLTHLVRLIDDLLDVSRITRGKLELRRTTVELVEVVRAALETARPVIDGANHQLVVSLPTEPIAIHADLTRLSQVISNILTNAAKYTPPGGRIELAATREDEMLVIRVIDNGIGIAEQDVKHVFEMFAQITPVASRSQGGLGIGLALARQLVAMHGGTIEATSAGAGHGSTFTVRLPIAELPAEIPTPVDSVVQPRAGVRVLIADDNRDAVETLATFLEVSGYEVRMASDGAEALEVAATFRPDVAVLDVGMPVHDGHEVARQLRARPEHAELVLIALTGWGQAEDLRRSREAGFDYHLTKPVQPKTLLKLLAEPKRAD